MLIMFLILVILILVGLVGLLWVDNLTLKQKIQDLMYEYNDISSYIDPVGLVDSGRYDSERV